MRPLFGTMFSYGLVHEDKYHNENKLIMFVKNIVAKSGTNQGPIRDISLPVVTDMEQNLIKLE